MASEAEGKLCGHHSEGESGHQASPGRTDHDHATSPHTPTYREQSRGKLSIVLVLTSTFMVIELVAGFMTGSLALMADAGHMLSDVASQILALLAIWFSSKPPTPGKTYGYYRTEILASLINGVALVGISIFIMFEAVNRLAHPPEVASVPMLFVAAAALVVNLISIKLLHSVSDHSLNVKAAYLEVLGDLFGSIGVIAAATLIIFTKWYIADPAISLLIGVLILPRTWLLLSECTNILMEGTPGHIDLDKLHDALLSVPGVVDVHDIHVWTITSGLDAMSGHVCTRDSQSADVLAAVTRIAQEEFGIQHTTIQIEVVN